MGVLINYKSCASALMPWDRHKVRNCPVTQALGLLHGTAEQQAASRSSRGLATPQTPASAQGGAVKTLPAPVLAGVWLRLVGARDGPQVGVVPHGEGWRDPNKGVQWGLGSTSALACPGRTEPDRESGAGLSALNGQSCAQLSLSSATSQLLSYSAGI